MKKLVCLILLSVLIVPTSNSLAQTKTAQFTAHSKSIYLGSVQATFNDIGTVELFFTTVDGSSSKFPLYQQTSDGILFSGEARPVSSNSSSFETDYAMYSYVLGEWIEFGRAVFKLPSTDSDNNGLLDILQYNKSGNFTTSGTGYVHAPESETTKLTGTFTRSKNNTVGNYSVYIASTKRTLHGQWEIIYASGNVSYTRGSSNIMDFDFRVDDSSGITVKFKASSQFTVRSQNEIVLPSLMATSDLNITYKVNNQIVFKRIGNRYQATVKVVDGMPQTSWEDYLGAVFEIVDTNDTDKDGVPDLSDNLAQPPAITSQPKSQEAKVGESVTFRVSANGTAPLTYQWYKNGNVVSGATGRSYKITNLRKSHFGNYTVVVSNSAGSITSTTANLSEIIEIVPPSFTQHPGSTTVPEGATITLIATASGTAPLFYQWLKNDVEIPGATMTTYQIKNAQPTHSGDYALIARNAGGETVSKTAVIQVLEPKEDPPTIVKQPQGVAVKKGLLVELEVKANGDNLKYQWFKDGSILDGATQSTYLIFAADLVDAGEYYVKITNIGGEIASDTVVVQVVVEIVTAFTKVVRSAGEVALKYKISPPHYYQIQSTSNPDFTSYEVLAQQNSTGFIENIVVQNDYSKGARFFRIALTEPQYEKPTIVTEPTSKTVESGNPVRFEVVVQSDTEASYKWFKNGEVIVGQVGSALIIPAASVGDAGDYTVEVTNKGGSIVTGAAKLNVKAGAKPPVITQQPAPLFLSRNSSGTLSVVVSGTKPFQFQWYRNGSKIKGATNSTYKIVGANPARHGGRYKVKVTNALGSVFSQEVFVFIE